MGLSRDIGVVKLCLGQPVMIDRYANQLCRASRSARPGSESGARNIRLLVVEQYCVVYTISIPKCLYFITYFNRRLGTWLSYAMLSPNVVSIYGLTLFLHEIIAICIYMYIYIYIYIYMKLPKKL